MLFSFAGFYFLPLDVTSLPFWAVGAEARFVCGESGGYASATGCHLCSHALDTREVSTQFPTHQDPVAFEVCEQSIVSHRSDDFNMFCSSLLPVKYEKGWHVATVHLFCLTTNLFPFAKRTRPETVELDRKCEKVDFFFLVSVIICVSSSRFCTSAPLLYRTYPPQPLRRSSNLPFPMFIKPIHSAE